MQARLATWATRSFLIGVLILFLIPQFSNTFLSFQIGESAWNFALLGFGDETHYFVILNSLLKDGDLDLKNNYYNARKGGSDAGNIWAGQKLQHHVLWYPDGRYLEWHEVFLQDVWPDDSLEPTKQQVLEFDPSKLPEYSIHPPGMPLVLALILMPFSLSDSLYLEPVVVMASAVSMFIAFLLFFKMLDRWSGQKIGAGGITLVVFFGTPLLVYSRMFFTESHLVLFAVGSYAIYLSPSAYPWRNSVLSGGMIALGIFMKPPFALLLIPLVVDAWMRHSKHHAFALVVLPVCAVAGILGLNHMMFGSPFRPSQPFLIGNPLAGIQGFWISETAGLLLYAPAVVIALMAWPTFWATQRRMAWLFLGGFLPYFLLMSTWLEWRGGYSYGPRLILPVLPFLFVSLVSLPQCRWIQPRWVQGLVGLVGLASVALNIYAVFKPPDNLLLHPLLSLLSQTGS